jgi:lysozyme family protein
VDADTAIERVLAREGGYVNNPSDRGGPTNYGITQATYAEWLKAHAMSHRDVRGITRAEAVQIYRERYWTSSRCDELPPSVRDIHFDAAVNHGPGRATKLLQEAAAVRQDGEIGPVTLAAVHRLNPELLRARYIAARYRLYGQIINRDRSQLAFITGWLNRLAEFS